MEIVLRQWNQEDDEANNFENISKKFSIIVAMPIVRPILVNQVIFERFSFSVKRMKTHSRLDEKELV